MGPKQTWEVFDERIPEGEEGLAARRSMVVVMVAVVW